MTLALLILPPDGPVTIDARPQILPAEPQVPNGRVREWLELVRAHQPGNADDAAVTAGEVSRPALRDLLGSLQNAPVPDADIKRGAVLHLDVALHVPARAIGPLLRGPQRGRAEVPSATVLAYDGRREGISGLLTHLEFARLLLHELSEEPSRDDFVRLWYAASSAFLSERLNFAELVRHLSEARRLLPDDPDVLSASGYLHEVFASPSTQTVMRSRGNESLRVAIGGEGPNLTQAELYLRRAVERAPRLAEARLRLGRVLSLRGRYADALPHLDIAREESVDAYGRYYALLFLGRALEALGRADEARAPFEAAAQLFPLAQSPQLALSRLALARGDQREAALLLDRLSGGSGDRTDPWWYYDQGPGRRAETLAAQLRAAVEALGK